MLLRFRGEGEYVDITLREFDGFHFMCAALLLPNCRDAFLRLSQLPSLRDRRFYSAILLAETQECVSTSFRRTHVNFGNDRLHAQVEIRRAHVKYTETQ